MTKYFVIAIISVILFLTMCCKDEPPPVVPLQPTNCEYPPGNRSFTWRLDTVAWFPSTVGGVWAFSDNDAYVMGYIVDGKPPYDSRAGRHWNGTVWEDDIHGTWGFYDDIKIDPGNDITGDDHFMVCVGWYGISTTTYAGVAEFDNNTKKWKSYQLQAVGELRSIWTDGGGFFIAAGDNGMVYIKDGYASGWVYSKAPTDFNLYRIAGISKSEMYLLGYFNTGGITYPQIWRYDGNNWLKILDDYDSTGTIIKIPNDDNAIGDLYAHRCSITDSLRLYIVGWESCLFETKGKSTDFIGINLSTLGLPLRSLGRTGLDINAYSPNDIWIFGTRYNFYHWNGSNFQKMVIPGLPNDDLQFGDQRKMIKTASGKVFLPTEVSSQVYVIVQGTP